MNAGDSVFFIHWLDMWKAAQVCEAKITHIFYSGRVPFYYLDLTGFGYYKEFKNTEIFPSLESALNCIL